jgi:iron complex transport system ATP-binding protein
MSLEAFSLSLNYSGIPLLGDVSLSVLPGKITTVVGPNGAGKTTLLRCLTNETLPTSGRIILNGQDIVDWKPDDRAKILSILPQHSSLDFPFTVEEVVMLARIPHDSGAKADQEIVNAALKMVDASYLSSRLYTQLSGGEKQRIHLARVLAQIWCQDMQKKDGCDRFLILDEPTSSFDLAHQKLTLEIIKDCAEKGIGVLVVMHDLNLAASCSDQVVLMECGKLVMTGSPKEVFTIEAIEKVFRVRVNIGENPETRKLLITT